jgi:transposase
MARRRKHSPEFKREAVRLAKRSGASQAQVAQELGIHVSLLRKWTEQFEAGHWDSAGGGALKSGPTQELEKLRRELNRVKTERDILKKALAYFAKEPT